MKKSIVDPNAPDARWLTYYQEVEKHQDKEALEKLKETPEGRWIISRIITMTGIDTLSYTGNAATYFNEGRRAIGIEIKNLIINTLGYEEGVKALHAIDQERETFTIRQNRIFNKEE